jgi:aminoglycoside phosphotransferase (APT) family kinase protein
MEFKQGRVLWDQSLSGMTREQRGEIYDEMNRVIAALHTVKFAERGLANYGKPGNYFDRQIGRWSKQYKMSADGAGPMSQPIAEMEKLVEWLPQHIPAAARDEGKVSIVHGDYRLDNLMFHPTEPRIIAVLDWELSTLGHPLADLGYNCMMYHFGEGFGASGGYAGMDLKAFGIPSEAEYLAAYARRTGRTEVPSWDFYLAFSLFRLAAIVQGVYKRGLDGNASSETATKYGNRAKAMADLAWSIVEKRA